VHKCLPLVQEKYQGENASDNDDDDNNNNKQHNNNNNNNNNKLIKQAYEESGMLPQRCLLPWRWIILRFCQDNPDKC